MYILIFPDLIQILTDSDADVLLPRFGLAHAGFNLDCRTWTPHPLKGFPCELLASSLQVQELCLGQTYHMPELGGHGEHHRVFPAAWPTSLPGP